MNKLNLKIPGKHNVSNAMAVLEVAKILKISRERAVKTLNNFSGTWRRMEYRGKINDAKIFDDYGHHPTEIKATLEGAKELITKNYKLKTNLWCVFQPHQYQRTYKLFSQFISAFDAADKTIILPIYSVPGREKESIKKKVSSEKLVDAINKKQLTVNNNKKHIAYIDNFKKAKNYLAKNLKKGDICLIMGAGDVNKLTEMLLSK